VVLGTESRIVIEPVEEAVQVYYLFEIINRATSPVDPSAPFLLDMPPGAQGTSMLEGSSPQAVATESRITVSGPFAPGKTLVRAAYQLPYAGGDLSFSQRLPANLEQLNLLIRQTGGLQVKSPQLAHSREATAEGQTYIVATGPGLPGGGSVTLELNGLPHHSGLPRTIALMLAGTIVALGTWILARGDSGSRLAAQRAQLRQRRERIFEDLVRLEHQRRTGSLEAARYESRRTELLNQLERIYSALDGETGPHGEGLAA
jgi:hypothetical protein